MISVNIGKLGDIVRDERYRSSILLDGRVVYSNSLPIGEMADLGESEAESISYYYDVKEEFNEDGDHSILNTFKIDKSLIIHFKKF